MIHMSLKAKPNLHHIFTTMFVLVLYMANSLPHPWIFPITFSQPGVQGGQGADALSDHSLAFFTDFGNPGLSRIKSG